MLVVWAAACAGCAQGPIPVIPVGPGPVDPGPVHPPGPVAVGAIDEAKWATTPDGMTEADLVAFVGQPFRKSLVNGFTVYVYAFVNSDSVAWFFVKDGKVVRKARL